MKKIPSQRNGALGDETAAIDAMENALTLAEPGGFIRIFIDLGPKMTDLLDRLANQNIATRYIGKILETFRTEGINVEPTGTVEGPSPLQAISAQPSAQSLMRGESEIPILPAPGLVNKEIASRLFISPEIVKKHTQNICRKLDVSNRQQAVARAYELRIPESNSGSR